MCDDSPLSRVSAWSRLEAAASPWSWTSIPSREEIGDSENAHRLTCAPDDEWTIELFHPKQNSLFYYLMEKKPSTHDARPIYVLRFDVE